MTELDRRAALALTAVAGATLGGLLLPELARAKAKGGEDVPANEDLMREHGVLRRILILYREAVPRIERRPLEVDPRSLGAAAALFRDFGAQYHEQIEEQYVFPAIRKDPGNAALADLLIAQHKRGREITAYIIDKANGGVLGAADAAPLAIAMTEFCRMYEAHAAREDTVVFPFFKKTLSTSQYGELSGKFERIERQQFGGDGFDMAVDRIGKLEAAFGIGDLSGFTAAPPRPA